MPEVAYELFDRDSGNLIDEFTSFGAAVRAVREELALNAPGDLWLAMVVHGTNRAVWSGSALETLVRMLEPTAQAATAGTVTALEIDSRMVLGRRHATDMAWEADEPALGQRWVAQGGLTPRTVVTVASRGKERLGPQLLQGAA